MWNYCLPITICGLEGHIGKFSPPYYPIWVPQCILPPFTWFVTPMWHVRASLTITKNFTTIDTLSLLRYCLYHHFPAATTAHCHRCYTLSHFLSLLFVVAGGGNLRYALVAGGYQLVAGHLNQAKEGR